MKSAFPLLFLLQIFSLTFHLATCEETLSKKLETPDGHDRARKETQTPDRHDRAGKEAETPDGLIRAEKLALAFPNNHKLASEEYYEATRHFIPFDKTHFDFDPSDWSVFSVPQSEKEQIIISNSSDITKELKISTIVRPMSDVILTYQIHMISETAPLKPTFTVFLITNGTKKLLIEESPQEEWKTTSFQIKTKKLESLLLFVGILGSPGNKIALRSFTFQDKSSVSYRRYGDLPKLSESEDILTGTGSHGNAFYDEDRSMIEKKHLSHGSSQFSGSNPDIHYPSAENVESQTIISPVDEDTSSNSSYSEYSSVSPDYTLLLNDADNNSSVTISGEHSDAITEISTQELKPEDINVSKDTFNVTQPYSLENWTNYENSEEIAIDTGTSVAGGVFNFFIVVIICATILIAFLMWRRRRNQRDDEIPVFSRTSIEHGNPTFSDTESNTEANLQRDSHSNYKSFE